MSVTSKIASLAISEIKSQFLIVKFLPVNCALLSVLSVRLSQLPSISAFALWYKSAFSIGELIKAPIYCFRLK
ncbi:hypothetical protein JCM19300_1050 [Algibacter lectus]|uniref:Uncharacterized protein n=1 Tax=Algibacter lectus TaxID=221126 RepID=A0A090W689_9FLAO|nr:hypothetical protein JCM19300_1050 [Algibacter lectus]